MFNQVNEYYTELKASLIQQEYQFGGFGYKSSSVCARADSNQRYIRNSVQFLYIFFSYGEISLHRFCNKIREKKTFHWISIITHFCFYSFARYVNIMNMKGKNTHQMFALNVGLIVQRFVIF